jgi:hypothetical protein
MAAAVLEMFKASYMLIQDGLICINLNHTIVMNLHFKYEVTLISGFGEEDENVNC